MTKSAEAFRTISEVADELELQKHVLRFWEVKFPQIKPMKRGGGRRYYRPTDLELLRGIRHLLHAEGYTIKGVQRIIREKGVDAVKRVSAAGGDGALKAGDTRDNGDDAAVASSRGALAAAGAASDDRAAPRKSARSRAGKSVGLTPKQHKAIVAVIEELQACRDELTAEDTPVMIAGTPSSRATG